MHDQKKASRNGRKSACQGGYLLIGVHVNVPLTWKEPCSLRDAEPWVLGMAKRTPEVQMERLMGIKRINFR